MAKSKYLAVLSASAVATLLASASTAMAADGDIYSKTNNKVPFIAKADYADKFDALEEAVMEYDDYYYEYNHKVYDLGIAGERIGNESNEKAISEILEKMSKEVKGKDLNEFKNNHSAVPSVEGDLKVESVSAINAKELKVTFNQPVDENTATNLDNYVISINNVKYKNGVAVKEDSSEKPLSDLIENEVLFDKDANSVVFRIKDNYTTLDKSNKDIKLNVLQNANKYSIDVKDGVLSADKSIQVARYTDTQKTFSDTNAPKLLSIEKTSDDKLSLTFDEPLADTTRLDESESPLKVTIDGEIVTLDVKVGEVGSTIKGKYETNGHFTIKTKNKLTDEQLRLGKHNVSVYNATDVAMPNHNIEKILTTSYTIEKDTIAPSVKEIKQIEDKQFVVKFSEPLKTFDKNKFVVKKGNYTFERTLNGEPNINGSTTYKVDFNQNDDKVVVTFGENKLKNAKNTLYDNDKNSVTLSIQIAGYKDLVNLEGSKYQGEVTLNKDLTVPNVTSKFDNEIKGNLDEKLDTPNANDGRILVKFDKKLKANDNLEKGNIIVTDKDGIIRTVKNARVIFNNNENVVEIALKDLTDRDNMETKAPFTIKFKANTVKTDTNEVGNNELTTEVLPSNNIGDPVVEAVSDIKTSNNNVITVTYTCPMSASAVNLSNYTLDNGIFPLGTTISMDGTNKVVTITLPEGYTNKTINKMLTISKKVKTSNGSTVVASVATKAPYTKMLEFKDNTKPVLLEAKYLVDDVNTAEASKKIKLVFNEEVDKIANPKDVSINDDLKVTLNGTEQSISKIENSNNDKKVIIVTLDKQANLAQTATISIVPEGKNNESIKITDASVNKNKAKVVTITTTGKEIDVDAAKALAEAKTLAVIKSNDGKSNVKDYTTLGINGVNDLNLQRVNQAVTQAKITKRSNLTIAEIQLEVNKVNTGITGVGKLQNGSDITGKDKANLKINVASVPKDGTKLILGNKAVGFKDGEGILKDVDFTININGKNKTQIADEVEKLNLGGNVLIKAAKQSGDANIELEAAEAGVDGNNIQVIDETNKSITGCGNLTGGTNNLAIKASKTIQIVSVPVDGTVLTLGNKTVGFKKGKGNLKGVDFTININGKSEIQIADEVEKLNLGGNVLIKAAKQSGDANIELEAAEAGKNGNNLDISVK